MNIPTDSIKQLVLPNASIKLSRLLITEISIEQDTPFVLYQVPFALSTTPNRAWKEALMVNWSSISKLRNRDLKTIIWVYHNRVLINNVPIELFQEDLEKMLSSAIEMTNTQMSRKQKHAI
ncbi:hypothetical protein N9672_00330 [Flavobacteriaceae bacterium]|nr:hypothetical protein [Flavobacteriaceae bacterium]